MTKFDNILSGGDLRSIGKSNQIVSKINNQNDFDELIECLFHNDRLVVMRAADVIEKVTLNRPEFLSKHKEEIITLLYVAENKELRWHLALIIPRLQLNNKEFSKVWNNLKAWATDKTNSRLVRVGAIQGLFEMTKQKSDLIKPFRLIISKLEKESVPSINARIRTLEKTLLSNKLR